MQYNKTRLYYAIVCDHLSGKLHIHTCSYVDYFCLMATLIKNSPPIAALYLLHVLAKVELVEITLPILNGTM